MPQRGLWRPHEQTSFRCRWPAKKGRDTHINILELETVWMACQKFKRSDKGEDHLLQTDKTMVVAYLLKDGGTHFKTLNGLARKKSDRMSQEWANNM